MPWTQIENEANIVRNLSNMSWTTAFRKSVFCFIWSPVTNVWLDRLSDYAEFTGGLFTFNSPLMNKKLSFLLHSSLASVT